MLEGFILAVESLRETLADDVKECLLSTRQRGTWHKYRHEDLGIYGDLRTLGAFPSPPFSKCVRRKSNSLPTHLLDRALMCVSTARACVTTTQDTIRMLIVSKQSVVVGAKICVEPIS